MSRAKARFTEADLKRAIKAARQCEPPWTVEIEPDGTIRLGPSTPETEKDRPKDRPLANRKPIALL